MPTITDSEFGEIVVKKQGLAKNISLRIAPDGRLRVTMPSYAPLLAAKTVIKTSRLTNPQIIRPASIAIFLHNRPANR